MGLISFVKPVLLSLQAIQYDDVWLSSAGCCSWGGALSLHLVSVNLHLSSGARVPSLLANVL